MTINEIKNNVKSGYAEMLKSRTNKSFLSKFVTCCDLDSMVSDISKDIGYSESELEEVPEGSNLGIGCGNPTALASIQQGETILDLGSGAGFDCFLAAKETGETGQVIGVDFTPEMITQANKNAKSGNYDNVEFKLGEIEDLPIENNTIDLIISNCVINLSDQKDQIFKEAFRVAKPNGRLMISDVILLKELPDYVMKSVEGHIACLSGTVSKEDYINGIKNAGFKDVKIDKEGSFPIELMLNDPIAKKLVIDNNLSENEIKDIASSIASISVSAIKY